MDTLTMMQARHARDGRLTWIGLRTARRGEVRPVAQAVLGPAGLEGDRARAGKRAVTLIQAEHLPVIASLAGCDGVAPETLRRNLVVEGINLSALRGARLRIGEAVVEITGPCAPCSRMEEALGPGGWNAMRGHGGWCASVLTPGRVALGDAVSVETPDDAARP